MMRPRSLDSRAEREPCKEAKTIEAHDTEQWRLVTQDEVKQAAEYYTGIFNAPQSEKLSIYYLPPTKDGHITKKKYINRFVEYVDLSYSELILTFIYLNRYIA